MSRFCIFFQIWGFKFFWGVALFRDPSLPVHVDARFVSGILEADQLTKTALNEVDFYFRFRDIRVGKFRLVATLGAYTSHPKSFR